MWDVSEPDPAYIQVSKNSAFKALELNANLAEPHFVLGAISYHHDWDWKTAEKSFKIGKELDSSYLWGLSYYANFLTFMGRFNESKSISEYLLKLDPLDPSGYVELSFLYLNLGQDEKVEELLKRSLEINPDFRNAKQGLALIYATEGINLQFVYDFCKEELGEFHYDLHKIQSFTLKDIGLLLALAGGQEKVQDILDELTNRIDSGTEDTPYCALGIIYNALGESEKAIDYLEKGVEIGEPFIFSINVQPSLQNLRSNKRFQDLIVKLGFEL
jgi:tetratricopeptide (TPR) repeat protein